MEILVKADKTIVLQVRRRDTLDSVKAQIRDTQGLPPERQRMVFNGQELESGMMLDDYDIRNYSVLTV